MWVGPDSWIDFVEKASPVFGILGTAIVYLIGTHTRSKVNDRELLAVTSAVERMERVIAELVEQKFRNQEHLTNLAARTNEVCIEVRTCRDRIDINTGDLRELRARVDYVKQRRTD